jgi:hypothetical protein
MCFPSPLREMSSERSLPGLSLSGKLPLLTRRGRMAAWLLPREFTPLTLHSISSLVGRLFRNGCHSYICSRRHHWSRVPTGTQLFRMAGIMRGFLITFINTVRHI